MQTSVRALKWVQNPFKALQALPEHPEHLELQAPQEQPVPQAQPAQEAAQPAPQALKASLEHKDLLALPGPQVHKEPKESQVHSGQRVQQERQAPRARQVLKALKA
jgi:hypothetical protein